MPTKRRRCLRTNIPIPVDPEFVEIFVKFGWQRTERIYGKRRTRTWMGVIGRAELNRMRREYRAALKRQRLDVGSRKSWCG